MDYLKQWVFLNSSAPFALDNRGFTVQFSISFNFNFYFYLHYMVAFKMRPNGFNEFYHRVKRHRDPTV